VKKEQDEDQQQQEEEYKWWLDENKDGSVKWTTLSHMGPLFPPAYVPHGVQMKYDGIHSK
jgi:DNA topoisomerase-1